MEKDSRMEKVDKDMVDGEVRREVKTLKEHT